MQNKLVVLEYRIILIMGPEINKPNGNVSQVVLKTISVVTHVANVKIILFDYSK